MSRIFDAGNNNNETMESNGRWFIIQWKNNNRYSTSTGEYTGSLTTEYVDDNGDTHSLAGGWISFEFPAYIRFSKFHTFAPVNINSQSLIGVDQSGTNRLIMPNLGISSRSQGFGGWKSQTITTDYFVNKVYIVITKSNLWSVQMTMREIFFDGDYYVPP
jgi:hypothetical protein